jgi:hypothetical protein
MTWGIQEALNQSWHPKDIAVLGAGRCNDINLLEIMQRGSVETHLPNCTVIGEKKWEWNRNPYQLQNNDTVFSAEKVQGLVLKNTCRE